MDISTISSTSSLFLYFSLGINFILLIAVIFLWRHSQEMKNKRNSDEIIATVFKEAELKATFIIHDAAEKAKTIITEATTSRQDMEKNMKSTFEEIFTTMKNQIKQESQAYSVHMQQTIADISALLKQESFKMITELRTESKAQV